MKVKNVISCLACLLYTGFGFHAAGMPRTQAPSAEVNDSLSLSFILKQVLTSYPSIANAREAIQAAEAGVELAKSGYYPNISANAGFAHLGPVPELTIPNLGHFVMAPNNNYNATLDARENIYDFGKTTRNVRLEKSNRDLAEKNVGVVREHLTLLTSVSFYSLIYLQEAIRIKETQIATLQQHIDFVTRKEQTGSATKYEILSTRVRLSGAENQKVDLEAARQTQQAILNSLLGRPVPTPVKVKGDLAGSQPEITIDSLIISALENRYEMTMARLHEKHAELQLRSVKAMDNPAISLFAEGGIKNGYFPDLNKLTPNYVAGVGLNLTIFDATRRRSSLRMASSRISMARNDIDQASRDISIEVYQNATNLQASLKKIDQSLMQVKQAKEALELAEVSFKTGAITNLDLLDSETALEESRVNLLKARVEYAINIIRLNISVGKPVQ